eukprot:TRINITY_DN67969_c9_g4_i1.p1 TRINITY_DN67969_c9_g4~~TRINITY_DN67969_c9_g4_i1.p1  ORF type:complete len:407 (-),score=12.80 TRINITY_DN67969_c9_g4_i1:394-1593(-)
MGVWAAGQLLSCCLILVLWCSFVPYVLSQGTGRVVRLRYGNETYSLPVMRLEDLRRLFQVNGGYIRTDSDGWVFKQTDAITSGEFIVPRTALAYKAVRPVEEAFFDRVRYRESQKDTRFAKTMRSYWAHRHSFIKEHFGRYVYWCGGRVQAVRDTQEEAEAVQNPCGGETALIARVGAEIDTVYTYTSRSGPTQPTPEGPMLRGPVATLDFELIPPTSDRRQMRKTKHRRFDNMVLDTGSAEVNLMHGDFNTDDFSAVTEVENRGLYGTGIARFVKLRVKFAEHTEYRPIQVLLNEDPIEHRLVGMRFLQYFYLLFGGPQGHWAAEPSATAACLHFVHEEGVDEIILHHQQTQLGPGDHDETMDPEEMEEMDEIQRDVQTEHDQLLEDLPTQIPGEPDV